MKRTFPTFLALLFVTACGVLTAENMTNAGVPSDVAKKLDLAGKAFCALSYAGRDLAQNDMKANQYLQAFQGVCLESAQPQSFGDSPTN